MRLHKAEIYFVFLLCLISAAGGASYLAWQAAIGLSEEVAQYAYLGTVLAGLSLVCGVLLSYPAIKGGITERGKLKKITEALSMRSETLEQAALTDALTGLSNRRYFDDALREYLAAFGRIDKPLGLLLLDLDLFKRVNDTYGHDVGDEVLRRVARCFTEFTRYHDVVARLGGEEFAVLSPNVGERQLFELAERIRVAVAQIVVPVGNVSLRVTVSAGVAVWDGKESGEELYKRADSWLYVAKRSGRNRVMAA